MALTESPAESLAEGLVEHPVDDLVEDSAEGLTESLVPGRISSCPLSTYIWCSSEESSVGSTENVH